MSKDNPTPAEMDAILQIQNGDYGVEVPEWWPVLPEAKEAIDRALYAHYKSCEAHQVIPEAAVDNSPMTITEFLEARIAEDEEQANAASVSMHGDKHKEPWDWGSYVLGEERYATEAQDAFIVNWWPARVLAECAAKRAIIKLAGHAGALYALVAVYAHHPDCRPEWVK